MLLCHHGNDVIAKMPTVMAGNEKKGRVYSTFCVYELFPFFLCVVLSSFFCVRHFNVKSKERRGIWKNIMESKIWMRSTDRRLIDWKRLIWAFRLGIEAVNEYFFWKLERQKGQSNSKLKFKLGLLKKLTAFWNLKNFYA